MAADGAVLHLLCGHMAAGKSTLAARLAEESGAVLIDQDSWLARLYPGEIRSPGDFLGRAARLREVMEPHIVALLRAGVSVVLDFPGSDPAGRMWMRRMIDGAGAAHRLHYIDVPLEVCRERLHARNRAGLHPFRSSDAAFDYFARTFEPPRADEGFEVVVHPHVPAAATGPATGRGSPRPAPRIYHAVRR